MRQSTLLHIKRLNKTVSSIFVPVSSLYFQRQPFRFLFSITFHELNALFSTQRYITKTYLYNFDPLKPHFYIVELEFTGVYIIFLISAQKHRLWVLGRTASARRFYQVPTICVLSSNMKNIRIFLSENFHFMVVKVSIYLNKRVFVMMFLVSKGSLFIQLIQLHYSCC